MPEHDTFYVISAEDPERRVRIVTVLHEVAANARELGSFSDPGEAIDFAQKEVQRLNQSGLPAEYVDPPDDLVGTG